MKKREPISHIMSKDVLSVTRNRNLLEARELMEQAGIRHLPVVDGGKVVGMLSRTDMMRVSYGLTRAEEEANKEGLQVVKVDAAMSLEPVIVDPDTPIREVAELFAAMDFSAVPVVKDDELVGMVTTSDLIRFLLEQY